MSLLDVVQVIATIREGDRSTRQAQCLGKSDSYRMRGYCRVKNKLMKGASQQAPKRVTKAGNIIYFTHFLLCLTLK